MRRTCSSKFSAWYQQKTFNPKSIILSQKKGIRFTLNGRGYYDYRRHCYVRR